MSQLSMPTEPDAPVASIEEEHLPSDGSTSPVAEVTSDEAPPSAGEGGEASPGSVGHYDAEIVIGEIPDTEDLTVMLWTARCTLEAHGLLGHFTGRDEAEQTGNEHLASAHAQPY